MAYVVHVTIMPSLPSDLLVITILCLSFKYGSTILCYDCNSAFDPRCGEKFDSFSLGVVNCSLRDPPDHIGSVEAKFCRSIKMDIYGKIRVVRQCGYLSDNELTNHTCRRVVGTGDLFVTYCACDTDLCNAAYTHHGQQMALFTTLILSLLVF